MSVSNESRHETDSSWLRREQVLDRFEAAWQGHGSPSIRDFLPSPGDDERAAILHELIKIDLEYRWAAGERPQVEAYLTEFPELGTVADCPIELVREEIHVRRYHSSEPTAEELAARFRSRAADVEAATLQVGASHDGPPNHTVPERLGRYELRELLGQGSFSAVYRAWDPELRRDVAIKVTRPELMTGAGSRGRVLREAQSAARLRHPSIVPIHEVGQDGDQMFIVYEYVPGPTLAALLRETAPSPRQAAKWVSRLAEALDYAHGCGIVHRDVKPANILLSLNLEPQASASSHIATQDALASGLRLNEVVPMLGDFGLARQADATATITEQGDVVGTPAYMSPEQARGDCNRVDARTDVYSLGVVLFELLTGQLPFRGSGASVVNRVIHDEPPVPSQLRTGVPVDLETICVKAMAKEPARRYGTAGAMADDLRRFLEHRPILARRVSVAGRIALWCRRRPALAATVAIATLVTLTAAATSYWRVVRERDHAELLSASLAFDRALNYCEQGEVGVGMLWLARSLELAPSDATDLQWAIRANLAAWQHELPLPVGILKQSEPVESLTFSDDGLQVIARSGDGQVESLMFSDDGLQVMARSGDGRSRAWYVDSGESTGDVADGTLADDRAASEIVRRLPHPGGITAAALSRDGERVITGGHDNTARLWDAKTSDAIGPPLQHRGTLAAVAFSRDGQTVLTGSLDRTARLWHAATGEPASPPIRHVDRVTAVAISPDGRQIATGCRDGTVWLWAVGPGAPQAGLVLAHEYRVWSAVFTPDGERLLTASGSVETPGTAQLTPGTAQLWNAATGERLGRPMRQDSMIREIAISTDGRTLVTGSWSAGPTVQIWDAASQEPLGLPTALPNGVTAVALSPDGRLLVSACMSESFAQAWELATPIAEGQPGTHELLAARFQLKHEGPVRSVVFSRDGRRIVTGSYDGTAQQWDAASGQRIGEPLRNRGQVGAVAYSHDSRLILTGTDESQAQLWHADTGRPAGLPLRHDGTVRGVAFSPDGQLLATASWDKTARLWHAATCKPVGPAMRHAGEVERVTFSPDGRTVVTSSWDKTARFWSVDSSIEASIDEVVRWVETLTGMTLDASEAAQVLDADSWKTRRVRTLSADRRVYRRYGVTPGESQNVEESGR